MTTVDYRSVKIPLPLYRRIRERPEFQGRSFAWVLQALCDVYVRDRGKTDVVPAPVDPVVPLPTVPDEVVPRIGVESLQAPKVEDRVLETQKVAPHRNPAKRACGHPLLRRVGKMCLECGEVVHVSP